MGKGFTKIRRVLRWLPTTLTVGNSLLGFTAILYTLNAYRPAQGEEVAYLFAGSAWMIIGAMLFDMLDGWTARMLHAQSMHGMQMDSLADMVTFGVAPGVLVAVMVHNNELSWIPYRYVWIMSAVYVVCVALRLALYNVMVMESRSGDEFHGLPSPGAAAAVCSLVVLHTHTDADYALMTEMLPFYACLLGFLMVSPFPYFHIGHWLGSKRRFRLKMLALIGFFLLFQWRSRLVTAVAVNLYVLSGPLGAIYAWGHRKTRGAGGSPETGDEDAPDWDDDRREQAA